jgi:S-formylglutathione hydrolase FrmB
MKDVIGFVDSFYNTIPTREGRVIGGLSMGGYGALKLALKFPDMFCSTVSHSGAPGVTKRIPKTVTNEFERERLQIFGAEADGGKDCLYGLAEKLDPKKAPAIRIDCGVDDGLLEDNRDFVKHLKKLKIEHEYEEFPGAHTWAYWDEHVREALAFHEKALGL